jgi:hypothetical protein
MSITPEVSASARFSIAVWAHNDNYLVSQAGAGKANDVIVPT